MLAPTSAAQRTREMPGRRPLHPAGGKAAKVSSTAVRKWIDGTEPRADAAMTIDDLRSVVVVLLEAGFEPARVRSWFLSRDRQWLEDERPLDCLSRMPITVLSAANDAAMIHRFGPEAACTGWLKDSPDSATRGSGNGMWGGTPMWGFSAFSLLAVHGGPTISGTRCLSEGSQSAACQGHITPVPRLVSRIAAHLPASPRAANWLDRPVWLCEAMRERYCYRGDRI